VPPFPSSLDQNNVTTNPFTGADPMMLEIMSRLPINVGLSSTPVIGNEEVLQRVNETRDMLDTVGKRKRVVGACVKT